VSFAVFLILDFLRIRIRTTAQPAYFEDYKEVCLIDFTSKRKRMTVLLQSSSEDKLLIFSKGADTIMRELVAVDTPEDEQKWEDTVAKLSDFGGESLRTLVLCKFLASIALFLLQLLIHFFW
jgi:magnesium-transporting ATPase (P-type)